MTVSKGRKRRLGVKIGALAYTTVETMGQVLRRNAQNKNLSFEIPSIVGNDQKLALGELFSNIVIWNDRVELTLGAGWNTTRKRRDTYQNPEEEMIDFVRMTLKALENRGELPGYQEAAWEVIVPDINTVQIYPKKTNTALPMV